MPAVSDLPIEESRQRVAVLPVKGRVSVVHPALPQSGDGRWTLDDVDRRSIRQRPSALRAEAAFDFEPRSLDRGLVELVAVVAVTALLAHDPSFGLTVGLVVGLVGVVRTLDRGIGYSFGQGFLGYRPDNGWPQGVQEDDDVRWAWGSRGQLDDGIVGEQQLMHSTATH
jgi:hypothetical protein